MKGKNLQRFFLDLLFPPKCMFCGCTLPRSDTLLACGTCLRKLPYTKNDGCFGGTENVAYVIAPFHYVDPVPRALRDYKFKKRRMYAESLAHFMVRYLARVGEARCADLILPVPLGPKRLYERGFNQSELVAKNAARELGIEYDGDILIRTRETKRQSSLSLPQRKENVMGAFGCAQAVEGKCIVLVDDIFTSGSTAESCARALKAAGARKIILAVLATASKRTEIENLQNRITPIRTK